MILPRVWHGPYEKDEDLQRSHHHNSAVRFWVLDAPGNRLGKTRGLSDELSSPNPRDNPMWPATERNDMSPMHGTAHCWEMHTVEPSSMVQTCLPNGQLLLAEVTLRGRTSRWLSLSTQCAKHTMERSGRCWHEWWHLPRRFYRDHLRDPAASMTTKHGAWQRLRYNITGIDWRRDQSSIYSDVSVVEQVSMWSQSNPQLQGGPKNGTIFIHLIISPNINWFSKFFHCQNQDTVCNKTITTDPTRS